MADHTASLQFFSVQNSFKLEYWTQTHTQSGNIHYIILEVHAMKQSTLKISFQSPQRKLDKNLTLSLLLP